MFILNRRKTLLEIFCLVRSCKSLALLDIWQKWTSVTKTLPWSEVLIKTKWKFYENNVDNILSKT